MRKKITMPKRVLAWVNRQRKFHKMPPIKCLWWTGKENFHTTNKCPMAVALGRDITGDSYLDKLWGYKPKGSRENFPNYIARFVWDIPNRIKG